MNEIKALFLCSVALDYLGAAHTMYSQYYRNNEFVLAAKNKCAANASNGVAATIKNNQNPAAQTALSLSNRPQDSAASAPSRSTPQGRHGIVQAPDSGGNLQPAKLNFQQYPRGRRVAARLFLYCHVASQREAECVCSAMHNCTTHQAMPDSLAQTEARLLR